MTELFYFYPESYVDRSPFELHLFFYPVQPQNSFSKATACSQMSANSNCPNNLPEPLKKLSFLIVPLGLMEHKLYITSVRPWTAHRENLTVQACESQHDAVDTGEHTNNTPFNMYPLWGGISSTDAPLPVHWCLSEWFWTIRDFTSNYWFFSSSQWLSVNYFHFFWSIRKLQPSSQKSKEMRMTDMESEAGKDSSDSSKSSGADSVFSPLIQPFLQHDSETIFPFIFRFFTPTRCSWKWQRRQCWGQSWNGAAQNLPGNQSRATGVQPGEDSTGSSAPRTRPRHRYVHWRSRGLTEGAIVQIVRRIFARLRLSPGIAQAAGSERARRPPPLRSGEPLEQLHPGVSRQPPAAPAGAGRQTRTHHTYISLLHGEIQGDVSPNCCNQRSKK